LSFHHFKNYDTLKVFNTNKSLFLGWLITACAQQWIITHLQRTFDTMEENIKSDAEIALFEILAMAVPNTICFLLFFVLLFHSWMNFLAEILMFGDREFYKDWWNAKDIITFWKNWNMPVHKWCVRHIYKPMLRDGYSKGEFKILICKV
jgi:diacylglycerol O-acyltransferase-1